MDNIIEVKKSEKLLKMWFLIMPLGVLIILVGVYGVYDSVERYWNWGVSAWLSHRDTVLSFQVILGGVLVMLVPSGLIWLSRRTKYQLTKYGIEKTTGIIAQRTITVPYKHIRVVGMLKRDIDRPFGTGVISVESAGNMAPEIILKGIEQPDLIKQLIEERING